MKRGYVYRGKDIIGELLRSYIFEPLSSLDLEGDLILNKRVGEGFTTPYEVIWEGISERTRKAIGDGLSHTHRGDFDEEGYVGCVDIKSQEIMRFVSKKGRSAEGWDEIINMISRVQDSDRTTLNLIPGPEAEEIIYELFDV